MRWECPCVNSFSFFHNAISDREKREERKILANLRLLRHGDVHIIYIYPSHSIEVYTDKCNSNHWTYQLRISFHVKSNFVSETSWKVKVGKRFFSFSWSSMNTMLQTSSIVFQTVRLTDELKIALEYDIEDGLLNVFVRNTGDRRKLPCQINVLSNRHEHCESTRNADYHFSSSELQSGSFVYANDRLHFNCFLLDEDDDKIVVDRISWENDQPTICIEVSNIYVYDLEEEENEHELCQTVIASSSSSCFDDQSTDNDDGYSTHSLDDTEQPQALSLSIPSCKLIVPFFDDSHREQAQEDTSPMRRLIAQLMWLSPFKKTVRQMMVNHRFG